MISPSGPSLTFAALARNEAKHLRGCFQSVALLKELTGARSLVILDSRADSTTLATAWNVADNVITADFRDFATQRNIGLDATNTEWLLYIDADERCTPALASEVAMVLRRAPDEAAFRIPRRNILFGREIKHTGWWPDYQVRLLKRDRCRYDEKRPVHEVTIVNGEVGTLAAPFIHYNYKTWREFAAKQRVYARLDAQSMVMEGKAASARGLIGQPVRELKRRLIDYKGYLDGPTGVALSFAMALYTFERQRQLLRMQHDIHRS